MQTERLRGSCGVLELSRLYEHNPINKNFIRVFKREVAWTRYGIVVFSDNKQSGNGVALAVLIKKAKLGNVRGSGWFVNPSSGSKIQVWTWAIDHKKLKAFK